MTTSFGLAEVAKHNTAGDCHLILHGKVYDVTDYLGRHPGGKQVPSAPTSLLARGTVDVLPWHAAGCTLVPYACPLP